MLPIMLRGDFKLQKKELSLPGADLRTATAHHELHTNEARKSTHYTQRKNRERRRHLRQYLHLFPI